MSEIKVNKIKSQEGSDAFTIASDGGVIYQTSLALTGGNPAWRIGRATDFNITTSGSYVQVEWDNTNDAVENIFMQNVTYSSGNITVPAAGIYQINATIRLDGLTADSGYAIVTLRRNGVNTNNADTYNLREPNNASYTSYHVSDIFKADANDTFSVYAYSSNDTSWHVNANVSVFSGARIG